MPTRRALTALTACALAVVLGAREARACGVSVGGAPGACSVAEHEASLRKYRLGVSYAYTRTRIQFSNGSEIDAERDAVMATFEVKLGKRFVLSFGAGALAWGTLGAPSDKAHPVREVRPGPVLAVSLAYTLVPQEEVGRPFVLLTGTFAGLITSTAPDVGRRDDVGYQAFDLRFGALVGTRVPLGRVALVPYAVARAFGGPILWSMGDASVLGTDAYKHQLGGGAIVSIGPVDAFIEGVAIGERALVGGLGVSF